MEEFKDLKLSNGLVAFGAENRYEKTKTSINLANYLAKNEKVLFLNWTDYSDKLEAMLTNKINKNLWINTQVNYFNIGSFLTIIDLIESYNFTTIIIDDIDYFLQGDSNCYFSNEEKDNLIKALKFISDKYNIRVLFNVEVKHNSNKQDSFALELADFAWSRLILNDCDQVLAIKNLDGIENINNKENYTINCFHIYSLKEKSVAIENSIITILN